MNRTLLTLGEAARLVLRIPIVLMSGVLVGLVRVYQRVIRPVLPPTCIFQPG